MKSLVAIVTLSLLSTAAFCQSSANNTQASATKQSANKETNPSKASTTTNTTKASTSTSTQRGGNPNGRTWYYCSVCGQKYSAAGKCPADGTTLVQKTIK
jgi:hypothetical protein